MGMVTSLPTWHDQYEDVDGGMPINFLEAEQLPETVGDAHGGILRGVLWRRRIPARWRTGLNIIQPILVVNGRSGKAAKELVDGADLIARGDYDNTRGRQQKIGGWAKYEAYRTEGDHVPLEPQSPEHEEEVSGQVAMGAREPVMATGRVYRGRNGSQPVGGTMAGVPGRPEQPREEEDGGGRGLGSGCDDPYDPSRSGAIRAVEGGRICHDDSYNDAAEAGGFSWHG